MYPGDTVPVMLNCSVTNRPLAPFNFLIWNVPTGGGSQFLLSSMFRNASNSLFSVTLTSVNDTAGTISSQLTFIINETLDEMKVTCLDNEDPQNKDTCTILVLSKSICSVNVHYSIQLNKLICVISGGLVN